MGARTLHGPHQVAQMGDVNNRFECTVAGVVLEIGLGIEVPIQRRRIIDDPLHLSVENIGTIGVVDIWLGVVLGIGYDRDGELLGRRR